jgi:hypothetical protein
MQTKNLIISIITVLALSTLLLVGFLSSGYFINKEKPAEKPSKTTISEKLPPKIYESEAESADECTSIEEYDAIRKVCYYKCSSAAQCQKIQSEVEDELNSWATELDEGKFKTDETKPTSKAKILAKYNINKGEKLEFLEGNNAPEFQSLWQEVAELSPELLSDNYIEKFNIYTEDNDTLAFVIDEDDNQKWEISINLSQFGQSNPKEQKSTLIHELAHIISLNSSQLDRNYEQCDNLKIDEGCTKTVSYLNKFNNEFWKSKDTKYSDEGFISEYAATNVAEDFAESFAYNVLSNSINPTQVKFQKINQLRSNSELEVIRSEMRESLKQFLVRSKMAKS